MILKDYEKLPEKMKNKKVKEYYDIISKKKNCNEGRNVEIWKIK